MERKEEEEEKAQLMTRVCREKAEEDLFLSLWLSLSFPPFVSF